MFDVLSVRLFAGMLLVSHLVAGQEIHLSVSCVMYIRIIHPFRPARSAAERSQAEAVMLGSLMMKVLRS